MIARFFLLFSFILGTHFVFTQDAQFKKGVKAFKSDKWQEAVTNLTPAADAGNAEAQFMVGYCYAYGDFAGANDSIAVAYMLKSALQLNNPAMNELISVYTRMSYTDRAKLIDLYAWSEINYAYNPNTTTNQVRNFCKTALGEREFKAALNLLNDYQQQLDKINLSALSTKDFDHSINLEFTSTKETLLTDDLFRDWVSRWKRERFQCETFYYTETINPAIIDSAIQVISKKTLFEQQSLYNGDLKENITLTIDEQQQLIKELERLKNERLPENLFPQSKRITQAEIASTLEITEKLPTESEQYMCSIIYTFCKPVFFRDNTIALFLDQKTYIGNYTHLTFSFYTYENDRWIKNATVYSYVESAK